MDYSLKVGVLIGAARGALISSMFGAGWLGWGLGNANVFNGFVFVAPTFGFLAMLLFSCSIYFFRKGRQLRKQHPTIDGPRRKTAAKWFLLVALIEGIAIAFVSFLANHLHRADLATDWCAMVVGLHFLPLAKIFRVPRFTILGILMTLWGVACWALFHSSAIAISASIGTGILLWCWCVYSLFIARSVAQSLST